MDSLPLPTDIISYIRLYDSHPVADMIRNAYAYQAWFMVDYDALGVNWASGRCEIAELYDTYQEAYQEYTKWYNDKNKQPISIIRRLKNRAVIDDVINRKDLRYQELPGTTALNRAPHHPCERLPEMMEDEYTIEDFSDDLYFRKYCLVDCDWCFDRIEKGSEEHGRCMTNGDELYCEDCQERNVWDPATYEND
jgi:hypothetical protein